MTKKSLIFITDLDRTIIHSKHPGEPVVEWMMKSRVLKRPDLDEEALEEIVEQRPVTHMTEQAQAQLAELLNDPRFLFVPCTMRNLEQVYRVGFLKTYQPNYIICTNGAQIYRNGQLDLKWESLMRSLISKEALLEEKQWIESLSIPPVEIRLTEDFYLTLKFESEEAAQEAWPQLRKLFTTYRKRNVVQVGRKIFIMHPQIDKVHAVDYLMQGEGWEDQVYTAGDSVVDQWFTMRGQALLPAHATFKGCPTAIRTTQSGIQATEEILAFLKQVLDRMENN